MTSSPDRAESEPAEAPIRVGVFGNSNSLLRTSYTRRLAKLPGFEVKNYSIGGAPNASLLYSVSQAANEAFDYIIVEPAVTDAEWTRNGYYTADAMDRNFSRFLRAAREIWDVPIVLLVLPTIPAIETASAGVRSYYRARALELGITLVDFYSVYERMFTAPGLREVFFDDTLHLSPFLFGVLTELLAELLAAAAGGQQRVITGRRVPSGTGAACVLSPPTALGGRKLTSVQRTTSLTAQALVQLGPGDAVALAMDQVGVLSSLVVNRQATSAIVELRAFGAGPTVYKDLRLVRDAGAKFMLHIVPVLQELHGRRFRLRVLSAEAAGRCDLEASSFQDRARCTDRVELCGAVLAAETAAPSSSVFDDTAWGAGTPIVTCTLPGVDAADVEDRLIARIEPVKNVLLDTRAHNVVLPRRKGERALRQLMTRIAANASWSPSELYRQLGSTFFKMGHLEAADMLVRHGHAAQPANAALRQLLAQIEDAAKSGAPPSRAA